MTILVLQSVCPGPLVISGQEPEGRCWEDKRPFHRSEGVGARLRIASQSHCHRVWILLDSRLLSGLLAIGLVCRGQVLLFIIITISPRSGGLERLDWW